MRLSRSTFGEISRTLEAVGEPSVGLSSCKVGKILLVLVGFLFKRDVSVGRLERRCQESNKPHDKVENVETYVEGLLHLFRVDRLVINTNSFSVIASSVPGLSSSKEDAEEVDSKKAPERDDIINYNFHAYKYENIGPKISPRSPKFLKLGSS